MDIFLTRRQLVDVAILAGITVLALIILGLALSHEHDFLVANGGAMVCNSLTCPSIEFPSSPSLGGPVSLDDGPWQQRQLANLAKHAPLGD